MIVTRSWLNEFIDLSSVCDERLYETFNAIGLEVDSMKRIEIDERVVVGEVLSVEKHPDADKLNVCQIDIGAGVRQIVCGASNVVDAKYVAVATIGAVLPENFEIKHAKLRGVESAGMVCASSELGLPDMGKGIMILDESIGELKVGEPIQSYATIADTIIELELTANRGDCLSLFGVARDLSSALNIEMNSFEPKQDDKMKLGIARIAELRSEGSMEANLCYKLATIERLSNLFLVKLRLAMVGVEFNGYLEPLLAYARHTTGVIVRAYDGGIFRNSSEKIAIEAHTCAKGLVEIRGNGTPYGMVGVHQVEVSRVSERSDMILLEASYIAPDTLVEAVSKNRMDPDPLYYQTSRGTNPNLAFGLAYMGELLRRYATFTCYEGELGLIDERKREMIVVDAQEISKIIGMEVELSKIVMILQKLGFEISRMADDNAAVSVPRFRHDICNIQDIAEEIVRIIGINNIPAKALQVDEKPRLNRVTSAYKAKRAFKHRAVGRGFYENLSYLFTDRRLLEKYHFEVVISELDLINPIAEDLNTLRTTLLINLLEAAKRNLNHTIKSIPLFEIGSIFTQNREEKEVLGVVFSGQKEEESLRNAGKPAMIDFATFIERLGGVVGSFDLVACSHQNGLIHPYQSADIVIDGRVCGFLSRLHPTAQEAFGLPVTFIAQISTDALMPTHINATAISKFQSVYKDLSIVLDREVEYREVKSALEALAHPLIQSLYPIDIYHDEALGDQHSLTIRLAIQSMEGTLEESAIESVMEKVMGQLSTKCGAVLR
jgi:phenylalanyl-tRNA synthetase beta chain